MTTLDDVVHLLERGMCAHERRAGCDTCTRVAEAVGFVRARFALPVIATCGACSRCVEGASWTHCFITGDRVSRIEAPPAWCPLRGAL